MLLKRILNTYALLDDDKESMIRRKFWFDSLSQEEIFISDKI